MTCPCGYVFRVPRFAVTIEVFDNDPRGYVVSKTFMTDSPSDVARALENAGHTMRTII